MHTQIWAHRGSSKMFIENSIPAFQQAIDAGAEGVELDVQRTKDGQLVVFHDEKLKRLTGRDNYLGELIWSELQKLTLGSTDEKIPSLEEVLLLFKDTDLTVNIELKNNIFFYSGMEVEIYDLVQTLGLGNQVLYSSFNHVSMKKMVEIAGASKCAILTSDILVGPWMYVQNTGAKAFRPMINHLQQKHLVQKCREHGLKVHVWTVDEDSYIYASLLLDVDAIITNEPEKALKLRQQFISDGGQKAVEVVKAFGLSLKE